MRVGVLVAGIAACYLWEARPRLLGEQPFSPMRQFGVTSLFIYWIHVEMAYGGLSRPIKGQLPLPWSLLAFVLFLGAMLGVSLVKSDPRGSLARASIQLSWVVTRICYDPALLAAPLPSSGGHNWRTTVNTRLARFVVAALIALAAAIGVAPGVQAQTDATSGTIEGVVSDTTGGVLPGATVRLTNAATGFVREVVTDEEGRYRGLALPLGTYAIAVEMSGFAKGVARGRRAGARPRAAHRLLARRDLGERITVQGGAPVIETTRPEQTSLIDEQSVAKLPINGRNFIDFVKLAPTVGIVQGPDGAEISVSGQRGIYNNVMIDGADANNPFFGEQRGGQRPKYIISLEAVKEFQVVTDGASAEFGRAVGGFVNMVTKSGTNRNQGTAFYFGRYGALLGENSDGTKDEDFSQHQFGGSFGGPIKRDKTFFFFSYDQNEEQREKSKAAFDDPAINPNGEGRRLLTLLQNRFGLTGEGGTGIFMHADQRRPRAARQDRLDAVAGASRCRSATPTRRRSRSTAPSTCRRGRRRPTASSRIAATRSSAR